MYWINTESVFSFWVTVLKPLTLLTHSLPFEVSIYVHNGITKIVKLFGHIQWKNNNIKGIKQILNRIVFNTLTSNGTLNVSMFSCVVFLRYDMNVTTIIAVMSRSIAADKAPTIASK